MKWNKSRFLLQRYKQSCKLTSGQLYSWQTNLSLLAGVVLFSKIPTPRIGFWSWFQVQKGTSSTVLLPSHSRVKKFWKFRHTEFWNSQNKKLCSFLKYSTETQTVQLTANRTLIPLLLITLLVASASFLCYRTVGNEVVFSHYNPNALLEYANLLSIFQNQGPYAVTMLATTILTASWNKTTTLKTGFLSTVAL